MTKQEYLQSIKHKIQSKGYKLSFIAEKAGISKQFLYQLLLGRYKFINAEIIRLYKVLNELIDDELKPSDLFKYL